MNESTRAARAALLRLELPPSQAERLVQYLTDEGFTLVPTTIVGAAGWTPSELWAYQMGYIAARRKEEANAES
jgi:hypothetical protein